MIRFAAPAGSVVTALLGLGLLAVLLLGLRDHMGLTSARRRLGLHGLRTLTVALASVLLLQPEWVTTHVESTPGRLAVLLDVSRSMTVRDGGATRFERARELVARWFDEASVKPLLFAFGDEVTPVSREALTRLAPHADATRLPAAIARVVRDLGEDLGGVVVVSDGGLRLTPADEAALRELGVPVHVVAVGEGAPAHDAAIDELRADRLGFVRQPVQIEVSLRSDALAGAVVPVTLRRGREVVSEVTTTVASDGTAKASLSVTPARVGRIVYEASIPASERDELAANNQRSFLVRVLRDKLRVLLVCGRPSWDARFLRALLKNDPAIDLITFFILRTQHDNSMAPPEELSLIPFPTEELFEQHLSSFDLVIFQDFDFGPYQMARYLPRIHAYVMAGGSFAMLGGDRSFSAGGYGGTPIEEVLPLQLVAGERVLDEAAFAPALVEVNARHPVVALLPQPLANQALWAKLSPLPGVNLVGEARAGALSLLAHPSLVLPSGGPMPVLAVGEAGRGRTLALATDGSHLWGFATAGRTGDASVYERFWDRALRWLARDPLLEPAQVTTDRESYGPGAPLRITAWLRDEHYAPLRVPQRAVLVVDDRGTRVMEATLTLDAEGRGSVVLAAPRAAGGYTVVIPKTQADPVDPARGTQEEAALAVERFVVETGGQELADPAARPEQLQAIARATAGTFARAAHAAPALDRFPSARSRTLGTTVTPLCATPWFFAALAAAFGLEWWLRRRLGLR